MAAELKKFDIKTVERLQAYMRGAIVRSKLREVREQFQDIVYDLDGPDYQVLWNSKTFSIPIVTNVRHNEKMLSSQLGNMNRNNKVEISDDEKEDETITQEKFYKQNGDFHDRDLTRSSMHFEKSVRENLEERFDIVGEIDKAKRDKGVDENEVDENTIKNDETLPNKSGLPSRSNSFRSARDKKESDIVKMSGNRHRETESYGTSYTSKDSGNAIDFHMNQDRKGHVIDKDFKMDKEPRILQESSNDLRKTDDRSSQVERNSGNQAPEIATDYSGCKGSDNLSHHAKHSGSKISGHSSDSQSDASIKSSAFQSYDLDQSIHSAKKIPGDVQDDSFVHHSTPMLSKNTKRKDEELQIHPLLTDSWMTERSFDPVRSDDYNSSTSELSVSDLQQRREQISMELLWTQQAMESRKNYLRLKKTIEKDKKLETW